MPKIKRTLKQQLAAGAKQPSNGTQASRQPLWEGPESDGPNGGVTQSMLQAWLICRERFRLRYIEGWREADQFQHRTFYGNCWHEAEESLAKGGDWRAAMKAYTIKECSRYKLSQEAIVHWYNVCKAQFPVYVDYWAKHPDVIDRTPLFQEQVFDVPYNLPSGRTVRLRGKWDSVDLVGKDKNAGIWLMENKTKGDINEQQMKRQLNMDLQTMLYLVSMVEQQNEDPDGVLCYPIVGVRYNVIHRPLSGGNGSIRRHKATKNKPEETHEAFYQRLVDDYIAKHPEQWFMRWNVLISKQDIERFKRESLDPILENLAHWYDHQSGACDPTEACYGIPPSHFRLPYGIYSPLLDGGSSSLDELLDSGSELGLQRVDSLFGELATTKE